MNDDCGIRYWSCLRRILFRMRSSHGWILFLSFYCIKILKYVLRSLMTNVSCVQRHFISFDSVSFTRKSTISIDRRNFLLTASSVFIEALLIRQQINLFSFCFLYFFLSHAIALFVSLIFDALVGLIMLRAHILTLHV